MNQRRQWFFDYFGYTVSSISTTAVCSLQNLRRPYPSRVGKGPLYIMRGLAYLMNMTKLLEKAFEPVRRLPSASQNQIALAMLSLNGSEGGSAS